MNPRDTQFQGFAKALLEELLGDVLNEYGFIGGRENYADLNHDLNICEEIIARRAYDLVSHAIDNSRANDMEDWETERIMPYVPDMNELPKEQEERDNGEIRKALEELIHSDKWADTFNERGITSIYFPKEQGNE
jgi:hypothetical protein